MWLKVPYEYDDVLWMAPLQSESVNATERWRQSQREKGFTIKTNVFTNQLPIVSVGRPEVWSLTEIYPKKEMPRELKNKLDEADFYLVRLPCSFRPRHKEVAIEWARYTLMLHSVQDQPLIAFDLHPLSVTHEIKRDVKVTLGPTLKFKELEASIGNVAFGIEYSELQPVISATGAGESTPSWDYSEAKGIFLQGSKFMHVLIKAPKKTRPLQATADVVATLRAYGSLLNVVLGLDEKEARDRLIMTLVE